MHNSIAKNASPQESYKICKRPDWVVVRQIPSQDLEEIQAPNHYLLLDYQVQAGETDNAVYQRTIVSINDESCIEDMSQYLYELQPGSEYLSFHRCEINRNNEIIDALDADNIRSMQRESGLERHVASDTLTIELIIDDLRVGDTVDIEFTRTQYRGQHPLYGYYFYQGFRTCWGIPIAIQTVSVNNNAKDQNLIVHQLDSANKLDKKIALQPGDKHEDRWENLTPVANFSCAPANYWPGCMFVTSDAQWSTISSNLYSFYLNKGVVNTPLDVAGIKELDLSIANEKTILKTIRFVQDSIRYRSETNGIFTHTPKEPHITLKRRTGDCKDKSNLLVTLLKVIGVEAELALVNTQMCEGIEGLSPSPFLFDHMIVRLKWNGKTYFVDPTSQKQGGMLDRLEQLPYFKALLLQKDGAELCDVPFRNDLKTYSLHHTFDLRCKSSEPTIEVIRTYQHNRANRMRYYFASSNKKTIDDDHIEATAGHLEIKVKAIESAHVSLDDINTNTLITKELYQIETPLDQIENNQFTLTTSFYTALEIPSTDENPVENILEGTQEHRIRILYDNELPNAEEKFECNNEWFNYQDEYKLEGTTGNFYIKLSPEKSLIPKDKLVEYREHYKSVQNRSQSSFIANNESHSSLASKFFIGAFLLLMAILAVNGNISYELVAFGFVVAVVSSLFSKKE